MGMGDTLRLADIIIPAGVTLLDDLETVAATVTAPMREEEPEEVEGEEGEEGVEGEAEEGAEGGAEPDADASADTSSENS